MTTTIQAERLRRYLAEPISIQSLVAIRVLFGAILTWDCWRYIRHDRIARYYVDVEVTFPYFGWELIQPLPEPYIHWVWLATGVSAFLVMIGLFYRAAIVVFLLSFGYIFLLDRTQYLNHNYLVLLYAALLAVAPANRAWSVDAWLLPEIRSLTIPRWPVTAIKAQTEIVLIYAGIVKITDDWLRGEPLAMWLRAQADEVWIGPLFHHDWVILLACWGVIALHILGAPLLLWSRTRLPVFVIYCCFHVANSIFFNIGIFPWLTIAVTTIFFAPDWPGQLIARITRRPLPVVPVGRRGAVAPLSAGLMAFLALWFAVQLVVPQRQILFPNMVGWTGDGHRFSWRMRIYDRQAEGWFEIRSADGTEVWRVDPLDLLTPRQANAVLTRPDLIHAFAAKLEARMRANGHGDVAVHAHIEKSLNGRPRQLFVDPEVDLTAVAFNWFGPDPWVLPLETRAAEDRIAAWWPPLPLQKPQAGHSRK